MKKHTKIAGAIAAGILTIGGALLVPNKELPIDIPVSEEISILEKVLKEKTAKGESTTMIFQKINELKARNSL